MLVRPAAQADVAALSAIYAEEAATGIATFDVEPRSHEAWTEHVNRSGLGEHVLVAEDSGTVLGYASSGAYRPRAAYDRTRETSIYLDSSARGRGVGRRLYGDLLSRLTDEGIHTVIGVIALPNDASEALHRACGFEPVGVLPEVGYKFDRWIDTAFYARTLG